MRQPYPLQLPLRYYMNNKTGLQPVSRPVEQILGFYQELWNKDMGFLERCRKTCAKNGANVSLQTTEFWREKIAHFDANVQN